MPTSLSVLKRFARPKIILFGDSITELSCDQSLGFALAPALQHEYFRKLQIVVHGYGGYNTEHARHILEPILDYETSSVPDKKDELLTDVKLLTIFFGTNDATQNDSQFVPLERYKANLRHMVDVAQNRNIPTILVGPGLVDEYSAKGCEGSGRSTTRAREYSEACRQVSIEKNVPFTDMWHAMLAMKGWKTGDPIIGQRGSASDLHLRDILTDGVHFSGSAYHTIRKHFPNLKSENLSTMLPHISEIDPKDLPASLWQERSKITVDVSMSPTVGGYLWNLQAMPLKQACDCCNIRKIRCNGAQPCQRCINNRLNCTYLRQRQKSGPRRLRQSSKKIWDTQVSSVGVSEPNGMQMRRIQHDDLGTGLLTTTPARRISLSAINSVFEIFRDNLYGIWPLLDTENLLQQLIIGTDDIQTYALSTALCAATLSHLDRTITQEQSQLDGLFTADAFAQEARRVRCTYDYMEPVTLATVLTSYFLHIFYGKQPSRMQTAAFYIREAISFAQLLGMHTEDTYSRVIDGFLNLVNLFKYPGNDFFNKWTAQSSQVAVSSRQLLLLQQELQFLPSEIPPEANSIQRVDIYATRHWIRALAWKLSLQSGYIASNGISSRKEMSTLYPHQIALDMLLETGNIHPTAFEVHGPGMEVKMTEIATALANSIECQPEEEESQSLSFVIRPRDTFKSICDLIFSTKVMLPNLRESLRERVQKVFGHSKFYTAVESTTPNDDESLEQGAWALFGSSAANCAARNVVEHDTAALIAVSDPSAWFPTAISTASFTAFNSTFHDTDLFDIPAIITGAYDPVGT
ncbi:hypothetical protein TSTA_105420 [Talaromyces stipitatus ATCC 10500]|uniref:Zn(2)-C6 fungal-type domain-containing protein n=1 Tax=Talaromyces stipitatus (strain ATCC 10500 / CBS 375.48 / QM 6759 / NRRL 1006) TaxID=441959 RepID=B8MP92_TALSN|nr:uncharacterized protein TSTA_105420 [Talaromyces stipitatus ATCC 10500]EED14331.1 hypothetical protein TSTA_105420 [Talaromyces stipitatus ATCC 10500]